MNKLLILIKSLIIKTNLLNKVSVDNLKYEIIRILNLIKSNYNIKLNNELNKRIKYSNKLSNLETINNTNNYKIITYKFNKSELINRTIISKLVIRLLERLLSTIRFTVNNNKYKINTKLNNIFISTPVLKENLSKINILFYYYLPSYKTNIWFNRINKYIKSSDSIKLLNNVYKKSLNPNKIKGLLTKLNINIYNEILNIKNNSIINDNIKNIYYKHNMGTNIIPSNKLKSRIQRVLNTIVLKSINDKSIKNTLAKDYYLNKISLNNTINNNDLLSILSNNTNINNQNINRNELNNQNIDLILNNNINDSIITSDKSLQLNKSIVNSLENTNMNLTRINKSSLNYVVWSIDKLLGNLNNELGLSIKDTNSRLSTILSRYFGDKDIEISPLPLKYSHNNSEIFIKTSKGLISSTRDISDRKLIKINNRLPLINEKRVLSTIVSKMIAKGNILRDIESLLRVNISNDLKDNLLNIDDISNDLNNIIDYTVKGDLNKDIRYKNLTGWSILFKGKIKSRKGANKSDKKGLSTGSFKNILAKSLLCTDQFKLNNIGNNQINTSDVKLTSKGTIGINVTFNVV